MLCRYIDSMLAAAAVCRLYDTLMLELIFSVDDYCRHATLPRLRTTLMRAERTSTFFESDGVML